MPQVATSALLSPEAALGTLLTTESLLFAAYSVALGLADVSPRPRNWVIPGRVLVGIAIALLFVVALGAATAWWQIFVEPGVDRAASSLMIAGAIAAAFLVQPFLALFLAFGLRRQQ